METYDYQPMRIEDYDEIYALWESIPGIGLSAADGRDSIRQYLERNPDQSFVCRAEGRIVGTILCGNDGRRAYIHHTAVLPEYRRRGVATELVRLALASQRAQGVNKCHLFIFHGNSLGQSFWKQKGFTMRKDISVMSCEIRD